jgi:hypothetical protein
MGLVPAGAVTVTSTVPAGSAGEIAVIEVGDVTVKLVALVEPNVTAVAPVKLEPAIVTLVPPVKLPLVGFMLVTVGAGSAT